MANYEPARQSTAWHRGAARCHAAAPPPWRIMRRRRSDPDRRAHDDDTISTQHVAPPDSRRWYGQRERVSSVVGSNYEEHENRHERQKRTRWPVTRRVVKRAWRTVSPHDTRAARRSRSDERQGRAADLANPASAAPNEDRETRRRNDHPTGRSTRPAQRKRQRRRVSAGVSRISKIDERLEITSGVVLSAEDPWHTWAVLVLFLQFRLRRAYARAHPARSATSTVLAGTDRTRVESWVQPKRAQRDPPSRCRA